MPTAKAPPIIDFSPFYGTDPIAKANLISQIRDACLDKGFFQLINHNISPDLQARLFSHSRSFFSLPLQEKLKLDKALSTYNRGYEFIGSQIFEAGGPPDLKEGFLLGRNLPPQHPLVLAKKFNCGPNVYPLAEHGIPDADGFKQTTDEYWTAVYGLACDLLRAIALTLGVDEEYFDGFSNDSVTTLRLLHYPVQPEGSDPLQRGIGAHTDFGAVTLLLQGDVPGLQLYEDGEWVDVAPIPGAYVANVGDMINRWTNDRYKSNLHRAINLSGQDRYSVPFFFNGNPEFVIKCLPGCEDPVEGEKYEPTTVAAYLKTKYAETYGRAELLLKELREKEAGKK